MMEYINRLISLSRSEKVVTKLLNYARDTLLLPTSISYGMHTSLTLAFISM